MIYTFVEIQAQLPWCFTASVMHIISKYLWHPLGNISPGLKLISSHVKNGAWFPHLCAIMCVCVLWHLFSILTGLWHFVANTIVKYLSFSLHWSFLPEGSMPGSTNQPVSWYTRKLFLSFYIFWDNIFSSHFSENFNAPLNIKLWGWGLEKPQLAAPAFHMEPGLFPSHSTSKPASAYSLGELWSETQVSDYYNHFGSEPLDRRTLSVSSLLSVTLFSR